MEQVDNNLTKSSFFSRKYLFLILLLIILGLGSLIYFLYLKPVHPLETSYPINTKSAYAVRMNEDLSNDYFYKGEIIEITDQPDSYYLITLRSIAGNTFGKLITVYLPKYPPKEGVSVLGANFKEMHSRGFGTVDFRVRYDKNEKFVEWELIPYQQN